MPLITEPDGTVMQGNTKIKILQERGVDVNKLPSQSYTPEPIHAE